MSWKAHQMALDVLRGVADDCETQLRVAVSHACPAQTDHNPVQHRDGKPPWCPSCGRTARGVKLKEVGGR